MTVTHESAISKPVRAALQKAAGPDGIMDFATFTRICLYDPLIGYYQKNRNRVGLSPDTDFYTNTSVGSLFGELIIGACESILQKDLGEYTFFEIGAEKKRSVLEGLETPFKKIETLGLGEFIAPSKRAIVFSNELLDAQPFHRMVFTKDSWVELGVQLTDEGLQMVNLPEVGPEVRKIVQTLPQAMPEGYHLDCSLEAEILNNQIIKKEWEGLLLTFDYGKTTEQLLSECPQGTARAYQNHEQKKDLLAHPGDQDLTTHVWWDRQQAVMERNQFTINKLETQESFFMHHAQATIERLMAGLATDIGKKSALMQLLHPTHMGDRFQVLWGLRQ